jgi:hypothetical protein
VISFQQLWYDALLLFLWQQISAGKGHNRHKDDQAQSPYTGSGAHLTAVDIAAYLKTKVVIVKVPVVDDLTVQHLSVLQELHM